LTAEKFINNAEITLLHHKKGGVKMEPKVEEYKDSTCVASTGGGPMLA